MDTTTLFADPSTSESTSVAKRQKPRLPRRMEALTDRPIVRFIGSDDEARTRAGWQPWIPVLVGWLGEGRTPTVFVHTPANEHVLALARQLHADVRAVVPELAPLPVPDGPSAPAEQTLF
jgi:hypothetical protein